MQYVGVGRRAVATIIDLVLIVVVGYVIALVTGQTSENGFSLSGVPALLWFVLIVAYYIVMEAQGGATLGKLVLGIRVVKLDGSAVDWQAAIIRTVLRIVDGLLFYLVAAILVWTSRTRQRLGDRVANTVVVPKDQTAPSLAEA